jgi:hypothetical protein
MNIKLIRKLPHLTVLRMWLDAPRWGALKVPIREKEVNIVKKKAITFLVLAVLIVLLSASISVSAGYKKVGDARFREANPLHEIDESESGTKSDWFYYDTYIRENRHNHDSYNINHRTDRGASPERISKYTLEIKINEYINPEESDVTISWRYLRSGLTYWVKVDSWSAPTSHIISNCNITVTTGSDPEWDWSYTMDFSDYPDSKVNALFGDDDYEEIDVPDADSTTRVTTENNHELVLTMDEDNCNLYIAILDADTVACEITLLPA